MEREEDPLNLPPGLVDDLRGLYAAPRSITAVRDAAILAAARRSSRSVRWWRLAVPAGIAAAVALAAGVLWNPWRAGEPVVYARTSDIRDAFYVARQLKAHQALETAWDVNHDGRVDGKDVQQLAMAAVKIRPQGVTR